MVWADPPGQGCWNSSNIGGAATRGILPWPSELCEGERGSPAFHRVPRRNVAAPFWNDAGSLRRGSSGWGGEPLVELHTHPSAALLAIPTLGSTGGIAAGLLRAWLRGPAAGSELQHKHPQLSQLDAKVAARSMGSGDARTGRSRLCSVFLAKEKPVGWKAVPGESPQWWDELRARLEIMGLGEGIEPGNIGENPVPQAQWPPFFRMKSLEAAQPLIHRANLLPGVLGSWFKQVFVFPALRAHKCCWCCLISPSEQLQLMRFPVCFFYPGEGF